MAFANRFRMRFFVFGYLICALTIFDCAAESAQTAKIAKLANCSGDLEQTSGAPSARDYHAFIRTIISNRLMSLKSFDEVLTKVESSPGFARFLLEAPDISLDHENEYSDRIIQVLHFLHWSVGNMVPGHFDELQDRSLLAQLSLHGFQLPSVFPQSGREALDHLSEFNLKRMIGNKKYIHESGMEEAESLVNKLKFVFHHSTNSTFSQIPKVPIFSARLLEQMGPAGLNTFPFSKDLLKNDDQVFFFVRVFAEAAERNVVHSQYGKNIISLDHAYASRVGWISFHVMYLDNLLKATEYGAPDLAKRIQANLDSAMSDGRGFSFATQEYVDKILAPNKHLLIEARQLLHKTDFSVADFEKLVKNAVLNYLAQARRKDPVYFQRMIHSMKQGEHLDWLEFAFREAYGIPLFSFEFKIPVALPADQIRLVEGE